MLVDSTIHLDNVWGPYGRGTLTVQLCEASTVTSVVVNGVDVTFAQSGQRVVVAAAFGDAGPALRPSQAVVGKWTGNIFQGSITIPDWARQQLVLRNATFNVPWQPSEGLVPWLVPGRLLLFLTTRLRLKATAQVSLTRHAQASYHHDICRHLAYADHQRPGAGNASHVQPAQVDEPRHAST